MLQNILLISSFPSDIWHDQTFQFLVYVLVTLLAAISTIIVSLWIFRKQSNRKEISYEVVSDAPVANVQRTVRDKVEIVFNGMAVRDISLVVLRISNTGNSPIPSSDYETPITLLIKGHREVLESDILGTEPKNLLDRKSANNLLSWGSKEVHFKPFLLNVKESVTISILLAGLHGEIEGRARIIGGELVELNTNRITVNTMHWLVPISLGMLAMLIFWTLASYVFHIFTTQSTDFTILFVLLIVSLFMLFIGLTLTANLARKIKRRI